jgi:hypothetical protein
MILMLSEVDLPKYSMLQSCLLLPACQPIMLLGQYL